MQSYFLCHQHEIIENQPRDFDIDIETLHDINSVVLLRHDNQLYCYQNRCPHLGIPLNWQPDDFLSIEKTHIQC